MKSNVMTEKKYNKLINEKSPYLLQHASNPINWYPWSNEVFEKAKVEDKPIFLSIGYSTCHWCHVMAHESFEDEEVAKIINDNFVAIKVDREERPDVDSVYMTVCQALTGHGGWPLTIIMTPDQKPFFAGTYFPKNSKHNMTGLIDILNSITAYWKDNKGKLILTSESILSELDKYYEGENNYSRLTSKTWKMDIISCYVFLIKNMADLELLLSFQHRIKLCFCSDIIKHIKKLKL